MELLRDRSEEFEEAGVRIFAISRDSPWTHIAWSAALDLTFPLLSDWNAEAVHGFDVAIEFNGMRDVAARSAFLVDGDGVVCRSWSYETAEVPDVDELLAAATDMARA